MLDLLGIDLENNDGDKISTEGAIADPWGMPIKTQPQLQSSVYIQNILTVITNII